MRELKFRMWAPSAEHDDEDNPIFEMIDAESLSFEQWVPLQELLDQEGIMQFTGLYDKNKKEIYEGDILTQDGYWGFFIAWQDGAFVRVPINRVQRINWTWKRCTQEDLSKWEIIGNIHENPELMED